MREFISVGAFSWDTGPLAMVLGCCYYSARMTLRNWEKVTVHVKQSRNELPQQLVGE